MCINNLDIAAISETMLAPKHRFSLPGYRVYRVDRNQFGGGVMLLVKNNARHDQFLLPNVVNLETIAVCLYLQNNTLLLFVSCYNLVIILHSDLDSVFSSIDPVVLVCHLNCKRTAWNCISVDRNGRTLLSYCLSQNIRINYPDHPTYCHSSSILVLLILLSQSYIYCPRTLLWT